MRDSLQSGISGATQLWAGCAVAVLLLAGCGRVQAGEVIDRIVATVDHRIILQSDWDEAVRFESLLESRPLENLTEDDRRKTLDRLIDQELVMREMEQTTLVRAEGGEGVRRIQEIRRQVPAWSTDEGWRAALKRYGLTEADVADRVSAQLDQLRFIDLRFRHNIHIDRRSIEAYYLEQFLPALHRAGAPEAPLPQVSPRIEEVLVQQRIGELFTAWLRNLRTQAEVQVR